MYSNDFHNKYVYKTQKGVVEMRAKSNANFFVQIQLQIKYWALCTGLAYAKIHNSKYKHFHDLRIRNYYLTIFFCCHCKRY